MKIVLLAVLAAVAAAPFAAEPQAPAERVRIAAERSGVEAQYHQQERACWARFGVNDCLTAARAKRRSALADLRRQEMSVNDAERKQRAAERLRSIGQPPGPAAPAARSPHVRDRGERDAKAAQRAAAQAARQAEHAGRSKAKRRADDAVSVSEDLSRREAQRATRAARAAENVRRRDALQRQARGRQEALQRRLAQRDKRADALPTLP